MKSLPGGPQKHWGNSGPFAGPLTGTVSMVSVPSSSDRLSWSRVRALVSLPETSRTLFSGALTDPSFPVCTVSSSSFAVESWSVRCSGFRELCGPTLRWGVGHLEHAVTFVMEAPSVCACVREDQRHHQMSLTAVPPTCL